jgi:hypothetical protein
VERWASPWRTVGGRISCAIAPVEAYNGTLDAINADVTLSAEGMRQKRIAVHATLMQGIADAQHRYVEQPRAVREGRADVLLKRGAIARPTDPAERAAYGIRMAEVRA